MSGIKHAVGALVVYLLLALVLYPALKNIKFWSFSLGTWLLLLACLGFLIQALYYISKVEKEELGHQGDSPRSSSLRKEG